MTFVFCSTSPTLTTTYPSALPNMSIFGRCRQQITKTSSFGRLMIVSDAATLDSRLCLFFSILLIPISRFAAWADVISTNADLCALIRFWVARSWRLVAVTELCSIHSS